MKGIKSVCLLLFIFLSLPVDAQDEVQVADSTEVGDQYQDDLSFMIQSLATMFNLLGDPEVNRQDKDQIINQSYRKYFESEKVQIEDDLDPNRILPINKNVQSYLQDIVFFYESLHFEFELQEVSKGLNDKNQVYYKASLKERLEGVNLYGEPFNEINDRYIEFNLDEAAQEFKMVSIYTTKLSEKEDLATWWNELDLSWRMFFADDIQLNDSLYFDTLLTLKPDFTIGDTLLFPSGDSTFVKGEQLFASIKKLQAITELVIHPADSIYNLSALHKFYKLEKLDFSYCPIDELSPLRSILSLREINASSSLVSSMSDLQYLSGLQKVIIDDIPVNDLVVSENWNDLRSLSMANSSISDLRFLEKLTSLENLNLSGNISTEYTVLRNMPQLVTLNLNSSKFDDIKDINALIKLHSLSLKGTPISSLEGINDSLNTRIISIENTSIEDISPLISLNELKIIYCDNSAVSEESVSQFIQERPKVLVIYETESLFTWWENLNENLKQFIRSRIDSITEPPSTETLHSIIFTENANLADQTSINSLEGFQVLISLKNLDISGTQVQDLSPIASLNQLSNLNVSNTPVTDLTPLNSIQALRKLNIEDTKVADLDSLLPLQNIELIKADNSGLSQEKALNFTRQNDALVLYQSVYLIQWWELLNDEWVRFFSKKLDFNKNPSAQDLQMLVNLDSLVISDFSPTSLEPLLEFKLLKTLELNKVNANDLSVLTKLQSLENLKISNVPITDYESLAALTHLKSLDLSTTSTDNLNFILEYKALERFIIASTAVESIRSIVLLSNLTYVDLSNTKIKKINYLTKLPNLKEVKLTNTLVNDKKIESFKKDRPDVNVIIY